jgi:hypothetical protein
MSALALRVFRGRHECTAESSPTGTIDTGCIELIRCVSSVFCGPGGRFTLSNDAAHDRFGHVLALVQGQLRVHFGGPARSVAMFVGAGANVLTLQAVLPGPTTARCAQMNISASEVTCTGPQSGCGPVHTSTPWQNYLETSLRHIDEPASRDHAGDHKPARLLLESTCGIRWICASGITVRDNYT